MMIITRESIMRYIELIASILTLAGIWFISEKLYIIGFTFATVSCIIWVLWCWHFRFIYLLTLEAFMAILYLKSLVGVS